MQDRIAGNVEHNRYLIRARVLGGKGVGKSSFILQFVDGHFIDSIKTIGYYHLSRSVSTKNSITRFQLFDIDDIDKLEVPDICSLFRGPNIFYIIIDLTDANYAETLIFWLKIANGYITNKELIVLVASKCDLTDKIQSAHIENLKEFAGSLDLPLYFCSAKNNINIDKCFIESANILIERDNAIIDKAMQNEKIEIASESHTQAYHYREALQQYITNELIRLNKNTNKYLKMGKAERKLNACKSLADMQALVAWLKVKTNEHSDTGLIGFFKATWARTPKSRQLLNGIFDTENNLIEADRLQALKR